MARITVRSITSMLVLLAVACSSDAPPLATPTATLEPSPAVIDGGVDGGATETSTPRPTPPAVELTDAGLPADAVGPLLVYSYDVRTDRSASRTWPTFRVTTYDVGASRPLAWFEVGSIGTYVSRLEVAGGRVLVTSEGALEVRALDGTLVRTLIAIPEGDPGAAGEFSVSHDGRLVAVAVRPSTEAPDPFKTDIAVIDIESGETILEVPFDHPGFEGEGIWLRPGAWRDDGSGFVVNVSTGWESGPRLATVRLDGSVHLHPAAGSFARVSPNGRLAAVGPDSLGCMFISGHRIALVDLDTDVEVAVFERDDLALFARAWSPDSHELLFEARPFPEDPAVVEECLWPEATPDLYVFGPETAPLRVETHLAAFERWTPAGGITFVCQGLESGAVAPTYKRLSPVGDPCIVDGLPVELRYRGLRIDAGQSMAVLAVIEVAP